MDALRRQGLIVFGARGSKTVDIECDETVIKKFRVGKELVWYYYIWFGFMERANPCTLWLKPSGLKQSEGEGRVGPMDAPFFEDCLDECFTEDTHANLFADSAQAFMRAMKFRGTGKPHVGVHALYRVNHSEQEWTRPEPRILDDWTTMETREGIAGTQCIDKHWDILKAPLPHHLSARSAQGLREIDLWVRHSQWQVMIGTVDPWPLFCEAVVRWRDAVRAAGSEVLAVDDVALTKTGDGAPDNAEDTAPAAADDRTIGAGHAPDRAGDTVPAKADGASGADAAAGKATTAPGRSAAASKRLPRVNKRQPSNGGPPPKRQPSNGGPPPRAGARGGRGRGGRGGRGAGGGGPDRGWRCALLSRRIGSPTNLAVPWYNDPRSGATTATGQQTAATCAVHAVNHCMATTGHHPRHVDAFHAAAGADYDPSGNFEWQGVLRSINAEGFSALPLVPEEYMEMPKFGGLTLGYLVHIPGHWVAVTPPPAGSQCAALVCDSLFRAPFELEHGELQVFWLAIGDSHQAVELQPGMGLGARMHLAQRWCAYRIYRDCVFLNLQLLVPEAGRIDLDL